MGYISSISMCMQNFITIFHSEQEIALLSLFFRIWSSAKPRPTKNVISQSLGLDLVNINDYATVYQNIPLSLRDRAIFTFSEFGARQSLDQCHFAIPWARSYQYQCVCKILSKYSKRFKLNFTVFRIWTSAKPRPIPNVIWLSHGLHHVNINVYAKFHHNIPLSSRDRAIFTFSEFGARQSLDRWKMSFHNSWARSC